MNNAPFFSIVMPVYNREKLVAAAIDSLIDQTYTNWQLIVVDDGSTDNTAAVVQAFTDARILYHYQTNAERSAARNKGISLASGSYILFLDSDDYFLPDHLQQVYNKLTGTAETAIVCGLRIDSGQKIVIRKEKMAAGQLDAESILKNAFHSQQVCLPRNFLAEQRYNPSIRIGEDTELWIRILLAGHPFVFCPEISSVVVREHEGRTIHPKNVTDIEYRATLRHIFSTNRNLPVKKSVKKSLLAGTYFNEAKSWMALNRRFAALTSLSCALLTRPQDPKNKFWLNLLLQLITGRPMDAIYRMAQGK